MDERDQERSAALDLEAERVEAALARAREGQRAWAALPVRARRRRLLEARRRLYERAEEAIAALRGDLEKPALEALGTEVLANLDLFDWWCRRGVRALRPERVRLSVLSYPGKRAWVERLPVGVVGLITPWNLPIAIPLRTLVPALLAGNALVWKPSEYTPRATAFVRSLFAGLLPEGTLEVLEGGAEAGRALSAAGLDRMVFTGSVRAGREVALACARTLSPVSLELGGKDAAIVLADADIERSARGIVWGAFYNGGQNCAAIERVYAERAIAGPLLDLLADLSGQLRCGPGGEITPLATEAQWQKVNAHLEDAKARGARVVVGGRTVAGGRYLEPTILTDVPDDALCLREETFGPLLVFEPVRDAEEAIARANRSGYGLNGSVWSSDLERARALARRLEVGVALVNNHSVSGAIAALPWSGVKGSGSGVTSSVHALEHLCRPRVLLIDRGVGPGDPWWFPYTDRALELLHASLRLLGTGLRRVLALPALVRSLKRRNEELRP